MEWCELCQVGDKLTSALVQHDRFAQGCSTVHDTVADRVDRRQIVQYGTHGGLVPTALRAFPGL